VFWSCDLLRKGHSLWGQALYKGKKFGFFIIWGLCTVNLAPAQSHIWHMLCKICFTIIFCWLHLRRSLHTMCQKNGEA
jgi:hypothetical protein